VEVDKIIKRGPILYAIAIMAIGAENMLSGWVMILDKRNFPGEAVIPVIPWVPAHSWMAYLTGMLLVIAGVALAAKIRPRLTAALLGILFLAFVVFLEGPRLFRLGTRTTFFETVAIGGSALILSGTVPFEPHSSWHLVLDEAVKSGRYLFAISSIVFGIDHLLYLGFVASLVPWWIPWHSFWAFFTGVAFIAAGLSIGTKWAGRWAAMLVGVMFLIWFMVLHLPRALGFSAAAGKGAPLNPNEWSSAFIALGMCGGSWICAQALSETSCTAEETVSVRGTYVAHAGKTGSR